MTQTELKTQTELTGGTCYDYVNSAITICGNYGLSAQNPFGLTSQGENMSGSKPIVICNGTSTEAKDMADAQAVAERLAHQHQADAYILKPIKKVAPKRDVVTTDLE